MVFAPRHSRGRAHEFCHLPVVRHSMASTWGTQEWCFYFQEVKKCKRGHSPPCIGDPKASVPPSIGAFRASEEVGEPHWFYH
jgi:hypothetical protein